MPKQCPRGLLWLYGAGTRTPSAALAQAFTRRQQGSWRTLATGELTRRSTGVQWAACTPRFAAHGSRSTAHPRESLEKAGAFEHQLKTIGKVTDG